MLADTRVNILMVDDQPDKLLTYEVILTELGENLIKATSVSEALGVLLKTDVAVILMDVGMPGLDGFELAEMIRQHPQFQNTAIILVSGAHLTDSDLIQGYRRGAVDYICVPVVPEVLRAKVSIFVELHRKTRALEKLNNELEQQVIARTKELRRRAELLDLASEAIIVRNLDGAILFWNAGAEDLYGWRRKEVLGNDFHDLLRTVFPVSREAVESSLLEEGSWRGHLHQTTRDGTEIVVACRKTLSPERTAVLEVNRDITAQLRTQEVMRETEKLAAMGRVANIIAHEINNPLEAVTNLFYLLRHNSSLNEVGLHHANLAEQELERISHITRQTLAFYRESRAPVAVSLSELLDDVVEVLESQLKELHISLEKRYFSAFCVRGFPGELHQVFLNLITNALEAMPNGGRLRLTMRDDFDWIAQRRGFSVYVTDTGTGISRRDAKRLFEPFFTTKSVKGTGLGLWIGRGIVLKYGGRISFRSYCPGSKTITSFRAFFPRNADIQPRDSELRDDLVLPATRK